MGLTGWLPTAQKAGALLGWHMIKNASHGKGGVVSGRGGHLSQGCSRCSPRSATREFSLGTNVIAIADSDEPDDGRKTLLATYDSSIDIREPT